MPHTSNWPSDLDPDSDVFDLIDREVTRQSTGLQLIASENFTSPAVMRATGSVLTNKYSEGYPGKRYYGGNAIIDDVEAIAPGAIFANPDLILDRGLALHLGRKTGVDCSPGHGRSPFRVPIKLA